MIEFLNVIYFLFDGQYVKIGKADNLTERLLSLTTNNPRDIKILATITIQFNTPRKKY